MSLKIFSLLGLALAVSMQSRASTDFSGTSIPIPATLVQGDEFQLIFVTSDVTEATNTSIVYYNAFVNTDATGVGARSSLSRPCLGSLGLCSDQQRLLTF